MRAVVQRVASASVTVGSSTVSSIGKGFLVLLGVEQGDGPTDVDYCVDKISGLRIFEDGAGKMNLALAEADGAVLLVSQFTLMGDCRKGRRPGFSASAPPDVAEKLYLDVAEELKRRGHPVSTGVFRADMKVMLVNDGPVTILLDSRRLF